MLNGHNQNPEILLLFKPVHLGECEDAAMKYIIPT
jgi:hypothetical protein